MKGIKIAIIVLIIFLLVGGGVFAYLFLKTDIFLTNEQAFLKYLALEDKVLKNYSKYNELQQVNEEAYISDSIIELNMEMEEEELTAGANISTVKDGDNIFSRIAVDYQDEEFLKFNYLKEDDKHGIKFPGIKQYVVLENNNLKEFAKILGLEEDFLEYVPNKITEIIPRKLIELTDGEKEQIKNLVINSIRNNISEERYSKEKSANIIFNGENIQATGYSLELTEKDISSISKNILEEVKGNEALLQLIQNKIDYIMYAEEIDIFTGYFRLMILTLVQFDNALSNVGNELSGNSSDNEESLKIDITRENILEVLDESINDLQEEIEEYTEDELIKTKISIYQNAGRIVKIKLDQSQEQEKNSFYSDDESEVSIISNIIEIDNIENEENNSNILVTIKSYIDEELQQGQVTQLIIENQEGTSIFKEQIQDIEEKILTTSEMKVSRAGQTIKAEGNVVSDQDDASVNIKYTNTIQIGNNNIEETLEDNEVVLNDLSLEQIEKIFDKIKETLEKEIQKKFPEFTFAEGNSSSGILEKLEEAEKSNKNGMLLDAVNLAVAQLTMEERGNYIYNSSDIEENGKLMTAIKECYSGDIVITEKDGNLEVKDSESNAVVLIELTNNKITKVSFPNETNTQKNNISSSMNELEVSSFNTKFTQYEGENKRGTVIRALTDVVETSNKKNDANKQVILEGTENIETSKSYSIETFDTDSNGFIDKIVVKEN